MIPNLIQSLVSAGQRDAAQMLANEYWTNDRNQGWAADKFGYRYTVASRIRNRIHRNAELRGMDTDAIY